MKIIKNTILGALAIALFMACSDTKNSGTSESTSNLADTAKEKIEISNLLDSFNVAVANADFDKYFNYYTEDAIFIGTDATEHWDKKAFMAWAKPYFDSKETWNFKSLKRHIYFGKHDDIAWFDELLDTQMKICRGSGVLVKVGEEWKVQQYVLSMTIPNDDLDAVLKIKSPKEDKLIQELKSKK
ncbi:nuclear transport factor 2 family protein [Sphingobacterium hungaricum]|nr:nuclear transport factor 2 family protein [Sphingobacterium hungaricum]